MTSLPNRLRACDMADLLACTAPGLPSLNHCRPSHTTRSTSSSGASRHSASAITWYTTTPGAGSRRSRWLALPVSASTSSISVRGHTLANTPALIRCATSIRAGRALRARAIVRVHRSFDGRKL